MDGGEGRRLLEAAITGELDHTDFTADPFFKVSVPAHVHGVPTAVLQPRETWSDKSAYDAQAQALVGLFAELRDVDGDVDLTDGSLVRPGADFVGRVAVGDDRSEDVEDESEAGAFPIADGKRTSGFQDGARVSRECAVVVVTSREG